MDFRRFYVYKNGFYCPEFREGFTGIMHGFVNDYIVPISAIREAVSILYISRFTFKGMLWLCVNKLPNFDDNSGRWVYGLCRSATRLKRKGSWIRFTKKEAAFSIKLLLLIAMCC